MLHAAILITDSSDVIIAIWMEIHYSRSFFFPVPLSHAILTFLPLQEVFCSWWLGRIVPVLLEESYWKKGKKNVWFFFSFFFFFYIQWLITVLAGSMWWDRPYLECPKQPSTKQTVIRFKRVFLLFVPKQRIVLIQLIRDTKQCLASWICLLLFCRRRAVKYNLGCYNCKNRPLKGWLNPNTLWLMSGREPNSLKY